MEKHEGVPKLVVFDCDMCLWSQADRKQGRVERLAKPCCQRRLDLLLTYHRLQRSPEMFELQKGPSERDPETNSVIAGRDRVTLFAGAILALRELSSQDRFSKTKIAVASSTSKLDWAKGCLQLLEVKPGVVIDELLSHREIYPDNKGRHFRKLHKDSGIPYNEMLFFDDCNYGDNCRDVEWACPGVVTVKTPEGLTPEKWEEGLAKFAESKR